MTPGDKKIVIVAGPNGAGKTTFAREFLPNEAGCPTFVNADLIAAGLAPFQPETAALRAGRLMLKKIARHAADGRSFAFETTLSGLTYVRMIERWRADGYRIELVLLSLATPEAAIARVADAGAPREATMFPARDHPPPLHVWAAQFSRPLPSSREFLAMDRQQWRICPTCSRGTTPMNTRSCPGFPMRTCRPYRPPCSAPPGAPARSRARPARQSS